MSVQRRQEKRTHTFPRRSGDGHHGGFLFQLFISKFIINFHFGFQSTIIVPLQTLKDSAIKTSQRASLLN